jgi:hypothetical protein
MKLNYTFVDLYELIIELYLDQDNHQVNLLNVLIALLNQEILNPDVHKMNQTL